MEAASRASGGQARRHGRNISHPVPTKASAGPLDPVEDPLSDQSKLETARVSIESTHSTAEREHSPLQTSDDGPPVAAATKPSIQLRFLQDPKIYHSLGTEDIADAFLNSKTQPASDASLPDLLQQGHFRRAAETTRRLILQSSPDAVDRILSLLYTRLACLVLLSRPDLAAQEGTPLTDLLARNPAGTQHLVPLIPWELRVLLVRLQSIGATDGGRRAIMSLYTLSSEVRANLHQAQASNDAEGVERWGERLADLGLRVCDTLVEMGELETATRHLSTLVHVDAEELAYRKALLRLRVGDVAGARGFVHIIQSPPRRKGLEALIQSAGEQGASALESWQALIEEFPGHELFAQNLAVSMLYAGHITSARDLLESLAKSMPMFPVLLFNLSTIYELCTEQASEKKHSLVQAAAAKPPTVASGGWERANFEFKL